MLKALAGYCSSKTLHFILLSCMLSYIFLQNLADTNSFHSDEVNWIPHSNQIFQIFFVKRDFTSPIWSDPFYYYGSYNPPIGKYLVGFGTYIAGYKTIPKIDTYNWNYNETWNVAQGNIHDPNILRSARLPIAITGIGVCLILFLLIQHFYSSILAFITLFVLIGGRLFWIDARSAIFDVPNIFFQFVTLVGLIYLVQALRKVEVSKIYLLGRCAS